MFSRVGFIVVTTILLAAVAGCGDRSANQSADQIVNSPEVQRQLEENQAAEQKRQERIAEIQKRLEQPSHAADHAADDSSTGSDGNDRSHSTDGRESATIGTTTGSGRSVTPSVAPAPAASTSKKEPAANGIPDPPKPNAPKPNASKPSPPVSNNDASWQNVDRWRKLRVGMRPDEVRQLLGEPISKANDVVLVYWQYGTGAGRGKAAFMPGANGVLLAWDMPIP